MSLNNGNYVAISPDWDNGVIVDAGAATWCDGTKGRTGYIDSTNSLVGSSANDKIGGYTSVSLANGNYVVASSDWDNGAILDVGAATWCDGTKEITGTINDTNSLTGVKINDNVGSYIFKVSNNNYIVSGYWGSEKNDH